MGFVQLCFEDEQTRDKCKKCLIILHELDISLRHEHKQFNSHFGLPNNVCTSWKLMWILLTPFRFETTESSTLSAPLSVSLATSKKIQHPKIDAAIVHTRHCSNSAHCQDDRQTNGKYTTAQLTKKRNGKEGTYIAATNNTQNWGMSGSMATAHNPPAAAALFNISSPMSRTPLLPVSVVCFFFFCSFVRNRRSLCVFELQVDSPDAGLTDRWTRFLRSVAGVYQNEERTQLQRTTPIDGGKGNKNFEETWSRLVGVSCDLQKKAMAKQCFYSTCHETVLFTDLPVQTPTLLHYLALRTWQHEMYTKWGGGGRMEVIRVQ